jgi:imidazolonepropionase-like amidohydrolase
MEKVSSTRAGGRIGIVVRRVRLLLGTLVIATTVVACATPPTPSTPSMPIATDAVLFEGARLIPGDGSPSIPDAAFLVERGRITRIGIKGQMGLPTGATRVDLTGKTVMPTLVDAHVHPGFQKGLTYEAKNYTYDNIVDDLNRALYFGVAVVQSQGIERGDITYRIRADQRAGRTGGARLMIAGRGIGGPNSGPGDPAYAGIAYEVTTVPQIRQAVQELATSDVDGIKIWVDDRAGRAKRLSPELYSAAIDEAHRQGLHIVAHEFYHVDAVGLTDAGIDAFAHSVRDEVVSDALVASLVKHGTYFMANLAGAEVRHRGAPDDPAMIALMKATIAPDVMQRVETSYGTRDPVVVQRSRDNYAILVQSLVKLNRAGVRIITGPDTGLQDNFFGFSEQRELELFVLGGMTPEQAIVAGTSRPAAYLRLNDMGSLVQGKDASFLVLDANPLDDIRNTRRIAKMFIKGVEVDRAAISAQLLRNAAK